MKTCYNRHICPHTCTLFLHTQITVSVIQLANYKFHSFTYTVCGRHCKGQKNPTSPWWSVGRTLCLQTKGLPLIPEVMTVEKRKGGTLKGEAMESPWLRLAPFLHLPLGMSVSWSHSCWGGSRHGWSYRRRSLFLFCFFKLWEEPPWLFRHGLCYISELFITDRLVSF